MLQWQSEEAKTQNLVGDELFDLFLLPAMHLPCLHLGSVHLGSWENEVFGFYQAYATAICRWTGWKFLFSIGIYVVQIFSLCKELVHEHSKLFISISVDGLQFYILEVSIHCLHTEVSILFNFQFMVLSWKFRFTNTWRCLRLNMLHRGAESILLCPISSPPLEDWMNLFY
jgi:hypothetical protein